LLVIPVTTARAQAEGALEAEIAQHERELIRLEDKLRESLDKSKALSEKEVAVIDEVERIDKELDSLTQEIAKGEKNMAANRVAAEKAAADLAGCESQLDGSKKELGQWLRLLCNQREPTMVEVILHDMPQSQITMRREMLSRLAREKAGAVERTGRLWRDYTAKEEKLSKRLELDILYTEGIKLRAQQSSENKKKREAVLARLQDRKNIYDAVISDLDASAKRLESMIESRREEDVGIFAESVPFRDMKGLLPWPTGGEITATYGRTKNPGSNTYTRHRGLDLSAPAGSQIRAIHDASIAYGDWFRGYGKLVILSHGGGYSSVYAHCSEIYVKKGDLVRAGQPIALVGETGSLKGPFLYFEVRENGKPVDPSLWLQRRNLHATQQK
jgi:septal ring factor EnvC (AmiA/AmiB activator)